MVWPNKLNITHQITLNKAEEKISKQKAKLLFESGDINRLAACRTFGMQAKFGPSEDGFCLICRLIAKLLAKKTVENGPLRPYCSRCLRKSDRLLHVKFALLVSVCLHLLLVWWVLKNGDDVRRMTPPPVLAEQRLQVTLIPSTTLSLNTSSSFEAAGQSMTSKAARSQPNRQYVARQIVKTTEILRSAVTAPNTTATPQAEVGQAAEAGQPKLELNIGAAIATVEQQRRKSPLASAVDAQQLQNGASKAERAFSKLETSGSNIVEEKIMGDGSRLIRFSGGSCMRIPNRSSRAYEDIRKPSVGTCG